MGLPEVSREQLACLVYVRRIAQGRTRTRREPAFGRTVPCPSEGVTHGRPARLPYCTSVTLLCAGATALATRSRCGSGLRLITGSVRATYVYCGRRTAAPGQGTSVNVE